LILRRGCWSRLERAQYRQGSSSIYAKEICASSRISLWTHTNNEPARRLFQATGFRPTGRCAVDAVGAEMIMLELEVRSLSA
jgi:hypothetical protein